jgi:hypothetical protein
MGRPPLGDFAMTDAERQRRHRDKFRDKHPVTKQANLDAAVAEMVQGQMQAMDQVQAHLRAAKARIKELESVLAAAGDTAKDARIAKLETDIAALKAELADRVGDRFAPRERRATKPKAEKPPLPPDEVRDREIKRLKTRVRNLTAELHVTREWHKGKADGSESMSFQTMSAISKALHLESRRNLTDTQLDEACKAFTAWKGGTRTKAQRESR